VKNNLVFLFVIVLLLSACAQPTETALQATEYSPTHPALSIDSLQPGTQTPYAFLSSSDVEVRYLLFLPDNYDPAVESPMIIFLHGSGGTGMNIDRLKNRALPNYAEETPDFPFIVVSPQLPKGLWTKLIDPIEELLDHLTETLPVDVDHLYLTGLSIGGYGTWNYALKYPDRFAAIAPIAGGASLTADRVPEDICKLKELPIWVFHGEADTVIPPEMNIEVVDALESCGANVKLTLSPDTGHDAWTSAYTNPAFYEWLLSY